MSVISCITIEALPLPDERPRQSVANLIGRFEQQGKRQTNASSSAAASPSATVVPRSSSVSSQIAGDSAKEEAKEKREWPPKSNPVASAAAAHGADIKASPELTPSTSASSSSSTHKDPPLSPQPSPAEPPAAADMEPTPTPTPASPESAKSPPPKSKMSTPGKSTPTPGTRRAPIMSPTKSRPSTAKTSLAHTKSPPPTRASLPPSAAQPLRPQHTGQSVVSNPSSTRTSTGRTAAPKTAPSTPSRPKTPATHASRPKTPSTGLFAPTAASLARSRNAAPPAPPPVKKATLSSSAAERLSKPTAASMSKARVPVPGGVVMSPGRVGKSVSSGGAGGHSAPRGPSKLRAGAAPARAKEGKGKDGDGAIVAATDASEPSHEPEHLAEDAHAHAETGHEPELEETVVVVEDGIVVEDAEAHAGHSEVLSDVAHEESVAASELVEHEHRDEEVAPGCEVLPESEHSEQQLLDLQAAAEQRARVEEMEQALVQEAPVAEAAHADVRVEVHQEEEPVPETTESRVDEVPTTTNGDEHKAEELLATPSAPAPATGNDIEDIVNLLEGTSLSKPRPQSIVTIPDEDGEILDEY
ncbi:hypothetical protein HYDPIDRAFT_26174 [Hydnomerulius pinastri MD-312]|nr:hypothetical protein HYDPIDRAFT_26174 [Hydnomerulius pinastri MD-312]